jgi:hypothetical protein
MGTMGSQQSNESRLDGAYLDEGILIQRGPFVIPLISAPVALWELGRLEPDEICKVFEGAYEDRTRGSDH